MAVANHPAMISAPAHRVTGLLVVVAAFAVSPAVWASKLDRGAEPPRVDSNADDSTTEVAAGPDTADLFAMRRWAFEGHLGIATPVGSAGVIVEYSPLPFLGVGAGAGAGSGPDNGNHFHGALVARARPLRGTTNALVLEGAYSFGGFKHLELFTGDVPNDWSVAGGNWTHWAQTDLGWEHRWDTEPPGSWIGATSLVLRSIAAVSRQARYSRWTRPSATHSELSSVPTRDGERRRRFGAAADLHRMIRAASQGVSIHY